MKLSAFNTSVYVEKWNKGKKNLSAPECLKYIRSCDHFKILAGFAIFDRIGGDVDKLTLNDFMVGSITAKEEADVDVVVGLWNRSKLCTIESLERLYEILEFSIIKVAPLYSKNSKLYPELAYGKSHLRKEIQDSCRFHDDYSRYPLGVVPEEIMALVPDTDDKDIAHICDLINSDLPSLTRDIIMALLDAATKFKGSYAAYRIRGIVDKVVDMMRNGSHVLSVDFTTKVIDWMLTPAGRTSYNNSTPSAVLRMYTENPRCFDNTSIEDFMNKSYDYHVSARLFAGAAVVRRLDGLDPVLLISSVGDMMGGGDGWWNIPLCMKLIRMYGDLFTVKDLIKVRSKSNKSYEAGIAMIMSEIPKLAEDPAAASLIPPPKYVTSSGVAAIRRSAGFFLKNYLTKTGAYSKALADVLSLSNDRRCKDMALCAFRHNPGWLGDAVMNPGGDTDKDLHLICAWAYMVANPSAATWKFLYEIYSMMAYIYMKSEVTAIRNYLNLEVNTPGFEELFLNGICADAPEKMGDEGTNWVLNFVVDEDMKFTSETLENIIHNYSTATVVATRLRWEPHLLSDGLVKKLLKYPTDLVLQTLHDLDVHIADDKRVESKFSVGEVRGFVAHYHGGEVEVTIPESARAYHATDRHEGKLDRYHTDRYIVDKVPEDGCVIPTVEGPVMLSPGDKVMIGKDYQSNVPNIISKFPSVTMTQELYGYSNCLTVSRLSGYVTTQ